MKTIIEAGHFYEVNGPTAASLIGWQLGKTLKGANKNTELALFIDDYHAAQAFVDPHDALLDNASSTAEAMAAEADHVFMEANIAKGAIAAVSQLLENSAVKMKRNKISTLSGGIVLGTVLDKDVGTFQPRCVFLDLLLVGEKVKLGGNQLVILPRTYAAQQAQLRTVLDQLQVAGLTDYQNVFYDLGAQYGELAA